MWGDGGGGYRLVLGAWMMKGGKRGDKCVMTVRSFVNEIARGRTVIGLHPGYTSSRHTPCTVCSRLQALVHDYILPPATAIIGYAVGLEKSTTFFLFLFKSNGSKFVTDNSNQVGR